jgi:hypothetical protein
VSEPRDPHADLLDELSSVLNRVDPAPPEVTEFATAALGWRRLDADLAELLADSALETESEALTRSGGSDGRWLTFRAADLAIDVEIRVDGEVRTLLGQLTPPLVAATVEVQAADGSVAAAAESDSLGRFRLTLEAGGRVRLRILRNDQPTPPVETSWLSI